MKKYLSLPLCLLIAKFSLSQLTKESMINTQLGTTFNNSKNLIVSQFSQKAKIMKSDFFGSYRIEYENVDFDYYGNAYYTYQFVKDTLVAIKIEFTFLAQDTTKFRRLYTTLVSDLNNDTKMLLLKKFSTLNEKDIFKYIKSNCTTINQKKGDSYTPTKTMFLGQNFWGIANKTTNLGKYLRLFVSVSDIHMRENSQGIEKIYDGCEVTLGLEMTSETYQDLKLKEESLEIKEYRSVSDIENRIQLKQQDGIYLIPIKLNNTISLDFVLDLGASDVSITPDIFLVLYKAGTIDETDFIGSQTYRFADGTTAKSSVFNIRSIHIGDKEIKNIRASISNSINAPLLLGQSALKKLNSYRIDNTQKVLLID